MDTDKTVFTETQDFHQWQWWLWPCIIGIGAVIIISIYFNFIEFLAILPRFKEVGARSVITHIFGLTFLIGILILIYWGFRIRLETRITSEGIHYHWRGIPFAYPQFLPWHKIANARLRKYSAIWEYGGWGLRGTQRNRAHTIGGKQGIQLELTDGALLLLGTQHPDAVRDALAQLNKLGSNPDKNREKVGKGVAVY